MFVKKTSRPRTVTLPNGQILTMADLPPTTTRWVARRKEIVVRAVEYGLLSRDEAMRRYGLSDEEFDSWINAVKLHGPAALKVTATKRYRQG
ncbi:DUF1153 domain-containing protein [Paracoccus seriniphilus]|uniref:DUF1153 domain-containing protein n=1 Tax=Paracoccus seriniphilus TaxID=184748 RepID=A0A239Q1F7_9RHOB|nr:DUF1153 domain-containing protein [Paracoccus seriniphilus]WCR15108.1 DUF1153 domain-containing protein [Paracoccus seriniphilus]SNT76076.1 Protein of unknown function [Paracoccus seriniphilus]